MDCVFCLEDVFIQDGSSDIIVLFYVDIIVVGEPVDRCVQTQLDGLFGSIVSC